MVYSSFGAGNAFSYAIYEHSKLSLRVFEAARIATAIVNGCEICKNWQSKRDIEQMGIKGGVTNNGEAPDNQFYKPNYVTKNIDTKHSSLPDTTIYK